MTQSQHWLAERALRLLRRLTGGAHIRFAIGTIEEGHMLPSCPVIRIRDLRTAAALIADPETAFGEGYSRGTIAVEGSLVDLVSAVYGVNCDTKVHKIRNWLLSFRQRHNRRDSRRNVHHHYDISNDFYRKWLDREMVYTCAYFPSAEATLEEAQQAKMEHVCRKLWLKPGEHVVEAGCGWGALALYMARNYGVTVKAFNVSHEQIVYARERATREGLAGRVQFIEDDYRNADACADAFVSVGMLEHVGREYFGELGKVIQRTIKDSGRGLLHFIGRNTPRPLSSWIRKRIFPGAYPPTLRESLDVLEPFEYSIVDVENLRPHYARTLFEWLRRFERRYTDIATEYGEQFARTWRLYLAGSCVAFRIGTLQLFQVTFAGRQCKDIPMTRDHLYARRMAEQAWSTGT